MTPPFPPRLHVILAREASTAIVIRRGPSKWCATFGWDRVTDDVRLGQWLHGKIYPDKCDLSPDGRYFIYFTMSGKPQPPGEGCWTALSKAPYLKALYRYPQWDTWGGGGVFIDNRTISPFGDEVRHLGFKGTKPEHPYGPRREKVLKFDRLRASGWYRLNNNPRRPSFARRDLPSGWDLRRIHRYDLSTKEQGRGSSYEEYELTFKAQTIDGEAWDWADWDKVHNRVVFTKSGRLHEARLNDDGTFRQQLIHDFTPYQFEAVVAPY